MKQNQYWIYGKHNCLAAINNPNRIIRKVLATSAVSDEVPSSVSHILEIKDNQEIAAIIKNNAAVIQGIAALIEPLPQLQLNQFLKDQINTHSILIILDQLSDPQNIGAIFRSAAAFGADAIITTNDNCPGETASLVKTAAGAFEIIPFINVINLSQSMQQLKENGYWIVGLDGMADEEIQQAKVLSYEKIVLVLGAEDKGLRPLTKKKCDVMVKIPINASMESLNVSNAAAIALYQAHCKRSK